jgi:TonB family protein
MEAVVAADGTVREIRVLKAVHPDLDAAAAAAAKQWRFRPARRDGQPVAVVVTLELSFRIK